MKSDLGIDSAKPAPRPGAPRRRGSVAPVAFMLVLMLGGVACLGRSVTPESPALHDPSLRAARIEELRGAIARDHATLEQRITQSRSEQDGALHADPEIRAIAARLSAQEQELERLEALQRDPAAAR